MAINKIILKDRHGKVIAADSFASMESADVTIVDGVGTPSATADYDNGVLSITMRNVKGDVIASFVQVEASDEDAGTNTWKLTTESGGEFLLSMNNGHRGNGIVSIEQTASSVENDGINEWTITETDGNETIISVKNGSKGSDGIQGIQGERGNGIASIVKTGSSDEDEGVNEWTITETDGNTTTISIKNGTKGSPFTYEDFTPEQLEGLKGSEIVSVEPVSISSESGGTNTYRISTNHGDTYDFITKNGGKGDQGDSAVYNPEDPDTPDFVMANTTGQSTTKAMTQKAVTDELMRISEFPSKIIDGSEIVFNAHRLAPSGAGDRWQLNVTNNNGYYINAVRFRGCKVVVTPQEGCRTTLFFVKNICVPNPDSAEGDYALVDGTVVSGGVLVSYSDGYTGGISSTSPIERIIPGDCNYIYCFHALPDEVVKPASIVIYDSGTLQDVADVLLDKINGLREEEAAKVEQTTGQSTTQVMSQKAVTDEVSMIDNSINEVKYATIGKSGVGDGTTRVYFIRFDFEQGKKYILNYTAPTGARAWLQKVADQAQASRLQTILGGGSGTVGTHAVTFTCNVEGGAIYLFVTENEGDGAGHFEYELLPPIANANIRCDALEENTLKKQFQALTDDEQTIARNNIRAEDSFVYNYTFPVVAEGTTPMLFFKYKFELRKLYRITLELSEDTPIECVLSIRNAASGASSSLKRTLMSRGTRKKGNAYYFGIFSDADYLLLTVYASAAEITPKLTIEEAKPAVLEDPSIYDYLRNAKLASGTTPLTLLHFSDIHGNESCLCRIIEMGKMCKEYVDDILCTGDIMNDNWNDNVGFGFWQNNATNILTAIGNHDVLSGGSISITGKQAYDRYIAPFVDNWDVELPDNAETDGKCYYYKDYPSSKIRLIVLDCMHYNDTTIGWGSDGDGIQNQWLQGVLEDARVNELSVVCAAHVGPSVTTFLDCTYTEYKYFNGESLGGNMMRTAQASIDEFVNNGGEFICWLHGHYHCDSIYLHNQDTIGISIDKATDTGTVLSTCARSSMGKCKDAFNIVSFDTSAKLIKLYKVGANLDNRFRKKGALCINYITKEIVYNQ